MAGVDELLQPHTPGEIAHSPHSPAPIFDSLIHTNGNGPHTEHEPIVGNDGKIALWEYTVLHNGGVPLVIVQGEVSTITNPDTIAQKAHEVVSEVIGMAKTSEGQGWRHKRHLAAIEALAGRPLLVKEMLRNRDVTYREDAIVGVAHIAYARRLSEDNTHSGEADDHLHTGLFKLAKAVVGREASLRPSSK